MSCCGSKRQQAVRAAYGQSGVARAPEPGPAAPRGPGSGVLFVYDGAGGMVVTGSVSGRRYRFAGRGARVQVDANDAPALEALPRLRRIA